jgi:nucleoside-diphosphate-sugar epimerase
VRPGTALVTGATGLVGSHIVERLLADGWNVRGLARTRPPATEFGSRGLEWRIGDVGDARAFSDAAAGCDAIFHCVAVITSSRAWEDYRRVNVGGTENAIAAAAASGARLLHLSSVAVYGGARYRSAGLKTDEDTPLDPPAVRAFYARSKRESEELVMAAHRSNRIWATAVRPCVIYGPRDRQFVPRIARALRFGYAPVVAGGRSILSVVHAANVADGAVRAVLSASAGGRAYNLANDEPVSVAEFFRLAGDGLQRGIRLVNVPLGAARVLSGAAHVGAVLAGGRMSGFSRVALNFVTRDNPFSSDRARRELGWTVRVHPQEGVPEAFRWWMRHH